MFLHTWLPHSIIFEAGPLTVRWYGVLIAVGALGAYLLVRWLAFKRGLPRHHIDNLFLLLVATGMLGGRLYHVLNEFAYYRQNPDQILAFWNGGLAIHGALIAGGLTLWWYVRKNKLGFFQLADLIVPGVALGQAIGRWGNYFNQELFGRPTTWPWGIPIEPSHRPAAYLNSEFFQPTFLFESIGNLLLAGLLLWLIKKQKITGVNTLVYLIGYSLLRIMTESLRTDPTPIIAGWRLPILVSLAIIVASVTTLIYLIRASHDHPN